MLYRLSDAAIRIEGQPMFKILAKSQEMEREGKDIIHFEIGDPDFPTPENIVDKTCAELKNNNTHYTNSMGLIDFRTAIRQEILRTHGFKPNLDQVLITPGANIIIYYAIRCLVNPGDEVIVPDPGFPSYYSVLNLCRAVPFRIPLKEKNKFCMNPDDVEMKITKKTRMIIINSPQNPTGAVLIPEQIEKLIQISEKHDIFLYSDEIYSGMIFDDHVSYLSPATRRSCLKRVLLATGFSKTFSMTGWRIGVAIGPEHIIEKMSLLLQTTSSCVSPFIQKGRYGGHCW